MSVSVSQSDLVTKRAFTLIHSRGLCTQGSIHTYTITLAVIDIRDHKKQSARKSTLPCMDSHWVSVWHKLQAQVYDIHPSTTAVFSYAIGPRKLSANEQFFVGARTVVSLLPTTQIISDACFITDHVATPAQIKPKLFETRQNLFCFTWGGCVSCLRACLGARLLPVLSVPEPFGGRWLHRWTAAPR